LVFQAVMLCGFAGRPVVQRDMVPLSLGLKWGGWEGESLQRVRERTGIMQIGQFHGIVFDFVNTK
jgi:hypothetical protein